jgi:hypothetical protein
MLTRISLLLLLSIFLLGSINSFAANIQVFVDRNPVSVDESFQLVFEANGTINGEPDFTPLETDFDILNQSQGSQISIINGQHSSTKRWTLTVIAKRTGKLTIPAIYFGHDSSAPRTITVQKAPSVAAPTDTEIFLEVNAEPKNPYVQSQVLYTVRLFYARKLKDASLTEPKLRDGEAVVEKLGEDSHYETRRDGKRFKVIERKFALFPQHSGDVTIEPLIFQGKIVEGRSSHSFFDDFFGRQTRTRTQRLRSNAIVLTVRPIPESFTGKTWLPAQQLKLQETWSENPPQFKAGEPITRTLTLSAEGLTAGQLPELSQLSIPPQGLKQYPDQPKLEKQSSPHGLITLREEKIAMIPSNEGHYTLAAIQIPWWNTETEQMELAQLPARTLTALPADNAPSPMTSSPAAAAPPMTSTHNQVAAPLKTLPIEQPTTRLWMWLSVILAIGWIGTLIAWWLISRRKTAPRPVMPTQNNKAVIKTLKSACHSNHPRRTKEALLVWAKAHFKEHSPNSLDEIAQRCGEPLQAQIQRLNRFLYSHTAEQWQGADLWKAFKTYNAQPQTARAEERLMDGLEPLYQTQKA